MSQPFRLFVVCAALVLSQQAAGVWAQENPSSIEELREQQKAVQRRLAEAEFRAGMDAAREDNHMAAYEHFKSSLAAMYFADTQYNMALCLIQMGQEEDAVGALQALLDDSSVKDNSAFLRQVKKTLVRAKRAMDARKSSPSRPSPGQISDADWRKAPEGDHKLVEGTEKTTPSEKPSETNASAPTLSAPPVIRVPEQGILPEAVEPAGTAPTTKPFPYKWTVGAATATAALAAVGGGLVGDAWHEYNTLLTTCVRTHTCTADRVGRLENEYNAGVGLLVVGGVGALGTALAAILEYRASRWLPVQASLMILPGGSTVSVAGSF